MRTPIETVAQLIQRTPAGTRPLIHMIISCFLFILVSLCTPALSQESTEDAASQAQASDENSQDSDEMKEMARAMKSMADMCQMMMQQEMKHKPVIIAAAAVVGTLLAIALVLFVVLEVQWIRYFGLRIRNERQRLAGK